MNEVWSWIAENYKLLVLIVACCLDIGLFLVGVLSKQKKSLPVMQEIIGLLPIAISSAEEKFGSGNGDKKFDYVMKFAKDLYHKRTGLDFAVGSLDWRTIVCVIENILSTPQKKGKNNGFKTKS